MLSSFVGSVLFCFIFVPCFHVIDISIVSFVSFAVASLLYCLSHHLKERVHDSDPMGRDDSDSSVGPGIFSFTRRVFLVFLFSLLFVKSVSFGDGLAGLGPTERVGLELG